MKKNKEMLMIIMMIVAVIVSIIIILVLLDKYKKDEIGMVNNGKELDQNYTEEMSEQSVIGQTPQVVKIENIYFMVDECMKKYLSELHLRDNKVLISYLNEKYIESNNINEQNMFNILKSYNNYDSYRTQDVYELEGIEFATYYVKGRIDKEYIYTCIGMDLESNTFDIEIINEAEYEESIKKKEDIYAKGERKIAKKTYNFVVSRNLQEEDLVKKYFSDYLNLMINDSEFAYNMLDEKYRAKKFENEDEFLKYVKSNEENLKLTYKVENSDVSDFDSFKDYYNFNQKNSKLGIKSYSVVKHKDYIEYICVDGKKNYCIFNVKNPGKYTVLLDSYTIDTEKFIEKYKLADNKTKVGMNIEKILSALNNGDYIYIYDKLDDSFKRNKFSSLDNFVNFAKENFYAENKVEYDTYEDRGSVFVYKVNFKDANDENNVKKVNIVMQIKEETNFVFSFSIE